MHALCQNGLTKWVMEDKILTRTLLFSGCWISIYTHIYVYVKFLLSFFCHLHFCHSFHLVNKTLQNFPHCNSHGVKIYLCQIPFLFLSPTRNSALADKPCDISVQMQCHGWPPKNTTPYVTMTNLVLTGCTYKYRKTQKNWGAVELCSLGRHGWHKNTLPPPRYHIKFGNSVTNGLCVNRREP